MLPAWRHTLQVEWPQVPAEVHADKMVSCGAFTAVPLRITRAGQSSSILGTYWAPTDILDRANPRLVILATANPAGRLETNITPPAFVLAFLQQGSAVLSIDAYSSGATPDLFKDFYTTYNRTQLQERVRDLLTICSAARSIEARKPLAFRLFLAGTGRAGLYALLAAPAADAVVAYCDGLDVSDESSLLASDLFCPGILAMGGFEGAAILSAPHPVLLYNTGPKFPTENLQAAYLATGGPGKLRIEVGHQTDSEIAQKTAHF